MQAGETGNSRRHCRPDVGAILADSDAPPSGSVLLVVNGFGGTPAFELYLMYNAARRILEKRGLAVARSQRTGVSGVSIFCVPAFEARTPG
jgi:dihydroxyacetone kinase